MTNDNEPNKRAIRIKKLTPSNNCINRPPKNGPDKLPILKKIPQSKLPVGSNSFGVRSVIYEIPRENVEPTNVPAIKNKLPITNAEVSNILATPNVTAPNASAKISTFLLPIRSLSTPNGNCDTTPPIEKAASMYERSVTSSALRNAYTG